MRVLYVTTISRTLGFFPEYIKMLQGHGHTVELAANMTSPLETGVSALNCKFHQIDFSRNPLDKDNPKAYKQLKKLLKEEKYDIVHTHTPIASAMVRLAARKLRKNGLKVFYTAHGFHFYKGAPLKNWLLFYPVEWLCAHWTDKLLTINQEDYQMAMKHMHAKEVLYVPGVGFDSHKFSDMKVDRLAVRKELGIADDELALLSVGEVNVNKNHRVIIKAIAKLKNPKIQYFIAGLGDQECALKELAGSLGIADRIHLLGYRNDVGRLYHAVDVCCFPTIREGLGIAGLEGMACGLPILAADNRGTRDYCIDHVNGLMCKPTDADAFAAALEYLIENPDKRSAMAAEAVKAVQKFDTKYVLEEMKKVYAI